MFEKEAEAYATEHENTKYNTLEWWVKRNTFQKGAEFGYRKAVEKHDLRKNPDDLPPAGMVVLISGYLGDMKGLQGLDTWDGVEWTTKEMPGLVRELWCELPTLEGIPDAGDSTAPSS